MVRVSESDDRELNYAAPYRKSPSGTAWLPVLSGAALGRSARCDQPEVIWILRGLAASRSGSVMVSTPLFMDASMRSASTVSSIV